MRIKIDKESLDDDSIVKIRLVLAKNEIKFKENERYIKIKQSAFWLSEIFNRIDKRLME